MLSAPDAKKAKIAAPALPRPVFVPRERRAEEAEAARRAEEAEARARAEAQRRAAEALIRQQRAAADAAERDERAREERAQRREAEIARETREREREQRRKQRGEETDRSSSSSSSKSKQHESSVVRKSAEELLEERRRELYLGKQREQRRPVKPSEKFRVAHALDWDPSDDTSAESAVLFGEAAAVRPLFGRGLVAGIDPAEQQRLFRDSSSSQQQQQQQQRKSSALLGRDTRRWNEKRLEEMTERDWRIFKEDHSIMVRGSNIPTPIRSWEESGLPADVLRAVEDAGYEKPSPIQMAAIPIGMQFRDIIGIAETGSGKTAAFVLPMLVYISLLPPLTPETEADGPYALILGPSRELVQQIEREARKLARHTRVRTVALFGGASIEDQAFELRKGCEIVVATPGRINDCIDKRFLVLSQCNYVVLDEADRMVEAGFEPQVNAVLDAMPASNSKSLDEAEAERQEQQQVSIMRARATAGAAAAKDVSAKQIFRTTIMFSATMPPAVERLARKYLRRPAQVQIGNVGRVVDTVEQRVIWTPSENAKRQKLREVLEHAEPPVIVFANIKSAVDGLAKALSRDGWKAVALHSNRTQDQRTGAMDGFKDGRYDVLVATDVAARGIDVHGVTLVLNYDMPKRIEDYTHRVGRTGRAGQRGVAVSFLSPEDTDIMHDLRQMLLSTGNAVPAELERNPAAQLSAAATKRAQQTVLAPSLH